MEKGDNIKFGNYEWNVLDIMGDKALIITREIIEQKHTTINMGWYPGRQSH